MQGLEALRATLTPTEPASPADELLTVAKTLQGGTVAKRATPDTVPVKLDRLAVDPTYQRPPDREKINDMVRQLGRGEQLEPIKVNRRPDGSLWITDGQHRAAARAIRGDEMVDAEVTHLPSQEEAGETNIMAKTAADQDQAVMSRLLAAGARRSGKRLILSLGDQGQVAYTPHGSEFVAKTVRGGLDVTAVDPGDVIIRLGLSDLLAA